MITQMEYFLIPIQHQVLFSKFAKNVMIRDVINAIPQLQLHVILASGM
jgi:hypothetical protein